MYAFVVMPAHCDYRASCTYYLIVLFERLFVCLGLLGATMNNEQLSLTVPLLPRLGGLSG